MWHPGRVAKSPEKGPLEPVKRGVLATGGAGGCSPGQFPPPLSLGRCKNKIPSSLAVVVAVPGSASREAVSNR